MEEAGAASNASNAGEASNASEVNGVVAVKEKVAVSSLSLLNHFLLAVQRALAWGEGVSGAAACRLLERLIEVGSARCQGGVQGERELRRGRKEGARGEGARGERVRRAAAHPGPGAAPLR